MNAAAHKDDDTDVVELGGEGHARDEEERDEVGDGVEDSEVADPLRVPFVPDHERARRPRVKELALIAKSATHSKETTKVER